MPSSDLHTYTHTRRRSPLLVRHRTYPTLPYSHLLCDSCSFLTSTPVATWYMQVNLLRPPANTQDPSDSTAYTDRHRQTHTQTHTQTDTDRESEHHRINSNTHTHPRTYLPAEYATAVKYLDLAEFSAVITSEVNLPPLMSRRPDRSNT